MSFLRFERLVKRYGAVTAVCDFTLDIEKGSFVSIVGPSGCGKTTTLRMIAGFIDADEGAIWLDGNRIDQKPTHQRGTAMVFQNYALFPHMTVYENVAFGLRMQKRPKPEISERVGDALALMRLQEFGDRFPKELSGGQQQRVALARAVVLDPKVLLLDEPLSNLDAKLRKELRAEFLKLHRHSGITTIFVTHDLEEAFSLSDTIAVMNGGRLEQVGSPSDIYNRPETGFVANFVGYSNVFEGVGCENLPLEKRAGGTKFAVPSHGIKISKDRLETDFHKEGVVRQVIFLGPRIQVNVQVGDMLIQSELPASPELERLSEGEAVNIGWNGSSVVPLPASEAAYGPG